VIIIYSEHYHLLIKLDLYLSPLCRGFWGYCLIYQGLNLDQLDLEIYSDPDVFIRFLSYIKERGVKTPQILKHISVGKKVLDFLTSGTPLDCPFRVFINKMDNWLTILARQLSACAPCPALPSLPSQTDVNVWAMNKVALGIQAIDDDFRDLGYLTKRTAEKVVFTFPLSYYSHFTLENIMLTNPQIQEGIIVSLVTGAFWPPLRLSIIKSMAHPRFKTCFDVDCLEGPGCRGNRLHIERLPSPDPNKDPWHFNYNSLKITLKIIHSKNDR
jgi:hypothetical protein